MIVRVHLHTVALAKEIAAAHGITTSELLGRSLDPAAIRALTVLDVRPEPRLHNGRRGQPRFDEPTLAMEFAVSGHVALSLKAAAKRLSCSRAHIARILADRHLGGLLHAASQ